MARPYSRVYHESRPFQGLPDLVRPIGERHRDARMVDDLLELPPGRHAQRGEEPRRAPRRDCENHTFRLVRRSAGHGEPPATCCRREAVTPWFMRTALPREATSASTKSAMPPAKLLNPPCRGAACCAPTSVGTWIPSRSAACP